jgi:DNA-binding GntR family transcriptional regulator
MNSPRRTANGAVDGRTTRGQREVVLSEIVRRQILDAIVSGEIAQGEVVQAAALAKKYQTSRTPVREALSSLERAGLITVIPYRGYMVKPITLPEAKDVFFMRSVIESAAASRAATRMSPAAAAQLWPDEPPEDVYSLSFDSVCHEFHRAVALAADSPRLLDALERIFQDVQRFQCIVADPPSPKGIHEEHLAIAAAIAKGDASGARDAMDGHIQTLYRQAVESLLG